MSDIPALGRELALIEARRKQIKAEMLKAWDEMGTFEVAGYFVAKIQSLTPEVYNTIAVAHCLPQLLNPDQHEQYYKHILDRIQTNRLNWVVKSLPVAPELEAMLAGYDQHGGMLENDVVGKPRKVIVKYEPGTGKREGLQHVLEPGDEPLKPTAAAVADEDDEEEGEFFDDGLSAGN